MEFILDTADLEAIKDLDRLLTVAGVTTNPSIISSTGMDPETVIGNLVDYLSPEQKLFVQTVQTSVDGILEEARWISQLRPKNMYVKIPVTHEGLEAIKQARNEGMHVLATAIYSPDTAFLAALNGADYLAPYVNRMCNYGDGVQQVIDLQRMLDAQHVPTKIVAASFKNADQVRRLIAAGIQAVTVPPAVAYTMIGHPGVQIAVDEFTAAWQKAYGRTTLRA
ncbi:transaldolase family protein [Collinsella sp. An2]|uniref:transaldolase family protein n=1 Tax=Collinsella sp. An2 TaxID=1965585 RepID=UPI000B37FAC6|nr:transaldolase family protein [Collinsella sp. An2]OUP06336.1 fructose-6-phosphate aldolase [Collinsella sp. An2]